MRKVNGLSSGSNIIFIACTEACPLKFALCVFVCVIKVSVPVAEVVGVEEGRVEILPQKSVEDTDKDFTGRFSWALSK